MKRTIYAALLAGILLASSRASALMINFDDLAPGTTLSAQYAAQGVVFTPNAFSGPGTSSSGSDWATNTDMTIVSIDTGTLGVDYGALGVPSLVAMNILHMFSNWQYLEDGDPSFRINFGHPVSDVNVTFAGVDGAARAPDTRIFAFNGSTLLGVKAGSLPDANVGQLTLSFSAPSITSLAVAPGSFEDWVGVDDINFTLVAVPLREPNVALTFLLGLAAFAAARRGLSSRQENRHV